MTWRLALLAPLIIPAISYGAILSEPDNSFILIDIDEPTDAQTYYGKLDNFPHTYQFRMSATSTFSAQVAAAREESPRLSLILVKEERRGVSEIARKRADDATWESEYDFALGQRYALGEVLEAELVPGVYKLEVSTPENLSPYQLRINGGGSASYGELFMTRSVFGGGWVSLLWTWRIAVPLILLIGVWWYLRNRKESHA